jgi:hypothetical protein
MAVRAGRREVAAEVGALGLDQWRCDHQQPGSEPGNVIHDLPPDVREAAGPWSNRRDPELPEFWMMHRSADIAPLG